ncbi:MAG: T9SS type A sorting domain-containing protein [Polaribacter sp.]|nr:T9SS type A sorting domain-containing protein [Polaribacter sp.]
MKKKLLYTSALIVALFTVYTVVNQDSKADKSKKNYATFFKNHPYQQSLKLTKKERKARGMAPNKYFEEQYLLEMNPNTGRTHPENYIEVQQALKANRKLQRVPGDATDNMWEERGPNNVGGRTRAVLFDPNDATGKRVFAGGVSGGLWVNNNIILANSSWTQVTNGVTENLSVSSITIDPNNPQIMYLGTGESYTGDDAIGNGVWKSTDGGANWVNVFSDNLNTNLRARLFYINDIVAWNNPTTNKTEVFIGVAGASAGNSQFPGAEKTGLYKSINDGATWTKVSLPAISGTSTVYEPNDIEIAADNSIWFGTGSNIYGRGGGTILQSTDGNIFSVMHTIADGRRVEIAMSKTNNNKMYVLYSTSTTPKILSTTNGFASAPTSVSLPNDADTGIPANDFTRGQSRYDLVIEVDPTNDNIIYAGGIDLFRSINGGGAWKQISKWSNNNNLAALSIPTVHADQHGWAFHPTDPNKALIGNDGGVYFANNLSGSETSRSGIQARIGNYNVTQFYHGEIGQSTIDEQLLAGAQDNGTQFANGANAGINRTVEIRGGDGAYSFIDKDGAYAIAAYVYNNYRRYPLPYNGTSTTIISESGTNTGSFINPADLDDNLDILYTNGASTLAGVRSGAINRFTNITTTAFKFPLTNALLDTDATVIKVSPFTTNSTKLFVGTNNGKLLRITNADTSPVWTNISGAGFSGSLSAIQFGASENDIMVTFHNYGVESIWYSANGGTTWASKEGDFPDIPVKAIMMNPLDAKQVIIGTRLGVWKTENFDAINPNWSHSYNGMSDVQVTSFSLRTADNTVMATTYGRGMFTGQFSTGTASVNEVVKESKVFAMYPTVSDGEFTIFAKNTLGKADLMLFNSNGKQVFSKKIDFTQQEKQSVSVNLSSGVYIVNLIDSKNVKSTGKVIIK